MEWLVWGAREPGHICPRREWQAALCSTGLMARPPLPLWGWEDTEAAVGSVCCGPGTALLCLPTCQPSMFISFVFIGPIFKLLPLWEALQGARIQNKTLIKMYKTLLLGH